MAQAVTNFELVLNTIKTLSTSQGFYSHLQSMVNDWDEDDREYAKEYFNSLPPFKDSVDVVLFLEQ